jgi:hypothetical protein
MSTNRSRRKASHVHHEIIENVLPPDQALLFSALREEFNAKVGSLKAWGIVALFGGQVVAGAMATYLGPAHAYHAAARALSHFV